MKTLNKTKVSNVRSTSKEVVQGAVVSVKKTVAKSAVTSKSPAKKVAKSQSNVEKDPSHKKNNKVEKKMTSSAPGPSPTDFSPYREASGEEYMNKNQLEHFREILELWKEQLRADRDATVQHMQDDSVNFPDILDRAALEEEHKLEWQAREREHKLINKIDQALARIKLGDYGYCEVCGAEIGIRRLEARPTATQCIDCKTIDEIREKQTGIVE